MDIPLEKWIYIKLNRKPYSAYPQHCLYFIKQYNADEIRGEVYFANTREELVSVFTNHNKDYKYEIKHIEKWEHLNHEEFDALTVRGHKLVKENKLCNCPTKLLMTSGCTCGGI